MKDTILSQICRETAKSRNVKIVYTRAQMNDLIQDPILTAYGEKGRSQDPHILVLILSHEGYFTHEHVYRPIRALGHPVFCQNNVAFPEEVAFPCRFHYHAHRLGETAIRRNYIQRGYENLDRTPSKGLLCLNFKPRLHRIAALVWLNETFAPDAFLATLGATEEDNLSTHQHLIRHQHFFPDIDVPQLIAKLDTSTLTTEDKAGAVFVDDVDPDLYQDTFASLVTETEMSDGTMIRYTEKCLKPLLMGHPFVVLGNPRTLRLLEEFGFDVLRDQIDQSYDDELDPQVRLQKALASAEKLARTEDKVAFLARNRSRLEHNISLFQSSLCEQIVDNARTDLNAAVTAHLQGER